MKQWLSLLLVIFWMLFIFVMSHQTGMESSATSGRILYFLGTLGIDVSSRKGYFLHLMLRKGAHFFEYFILSLLLYNYFRGMMQGNSPLWLGVVVSFLYACFDEVHQIYVPGRMGSWQDVVIDTTGASVAMLNVYAYRSLKKRRKRLEEDEGNDKL